MSEVFKGLGIGLASGAYTLVAIVVSFLALVASPPLAPLTAFVLGMFYPPFLGWVGLKL